MLLIINPSAGTGTALEKWSKIRPRVRELLGSFTTLMAADPEIVKQQIVDRLRRGETSFVAAGGDGTVNLVMSTIVEHAATEAVAAIKLGAIGLGSSNDFHKPLCSSRQIEGIPFKLNFGLTLQHDVCLLTYRDDAANLRTSRWFINASVGITADASHFFNGQGPVLRFLKRFSPASGIGYAALRTILGHRARPMTMTLDDKTTLRASVKNLGIAKNPHFTGALCYDSPHEPSSGRFYVHLLRSVSPLGLALALLRLCRGRFGGQKGAESWRARRLIVQADQPFLVEGDGEVVSAREACFSIMPRGLQVCT